MTNTIRILFISAFVALFAVNGMAQKPDTLIRKLDSLQKSTDTTGKQINNTNREEFTESTQLTLPGYFILLGSNMKQSFTKPFHMKKKDWGNMLKFTLLEAALYFADEPIQRNMLDLRTNNTTVANISKNVTQFGGLYEVYTLATLGLESIIFKNKKLQTTTLLATQSYLTAGAVQFVGKFLSGRQRPSYADNYTLDAEPKFHGPFYKLVDANGNKSNSSFPSGHTTAAFAAATVFSLEYKNSKLVPWVSYGAATLIGLSRMTENKHWFTDVVAGAALGYLTGLQVVNNYHRYAKIRSGETSKPKGEVSFNLSYDRGVIMPGMVYKFR